MVNSILSVLFPLFFVFSYAEDAIAFYCPPGNMECGMILLKHTPEQDTKCYEDQRHDNRLLPAKRR